MKNEMLNYLRYIYTPGLMCDTSFTHSAEVAIYWLANDYHEGQTSELYSILSTSPYSPSCLTSGIKDEDDEIAQNMYDDLVCVYNL